MPSKHLWAIPLGLFVTVLLGIRFLDQHQGVWRDISWPQHARFFRTHPRQAPRLMIVGDSISQGRNGDLTWRYHLWQWLRANEIPTIFVGPYTGTIIKPSDDAPLAWDQRGSYSSDADTAFVNERNNSAHFSIWGARLADFVPVVGNAVAEFQPDYLLVELGYNDIAAKLLPLGLRDTQGTLVRFVHKARDTKPDIKMAIANIPHRLHAPVGTPPDLIAMTDTYNSDLIATTDAYNSDLPELLAAMATAESPLDVVELAQHYECSYLTCPDGRDGILPNAQGELHIAQAFASALRSIAGSPFAGADPLVDLWNTTSSTGGVSTAAAKASKTAK